jgi:hypothetical protein
MDRDPSPSEIGKHPREDTKLRRGSAVCFGLTPRQAVRIRCWSKALKAAKAVAAILDSTRAVPHSPRYRLGAEEKRQEGNPRGDELQGPDSGGKPLESVRTPRALPA